MIGAKFKKMGDVTLATTLSWVVYHHRLGFDTVYLNAKFDDSSFSHARDIIRGNKIKSGSCNPNHDSFKGDFSSLCWDYFVFQIWHS